MSGFAVGVDLGGTKLLTALVTDRGVVLARERVATPQDGPPSVVAAIAATVATVLRAAGAAQDQCRGVAVGAPGPLNPGTGVVYEPPNLPGWHDVPLADMLRSRLGMPAHVENDANAAALGEWWVGAGRGARDLVYLTVGTGIGGGIIINDVLVHGTSGTAGEIGHTTIDINGPRCGCGRPGHLEAMASGTAIARMAREAIAAGRASTMASAAGGEPARITARIVAEAAAQGDRLAAEVFERAAMYVGVGVANLLNLLNPARVIIGGGVSRAGELLFGPVRRTVRMLAFERPAEDAQIVPAQLGDDVGAVGAAAVVFVRDATRA